MERQAIRDVVVLEGRSFALHTPPTAADKEALYAAGVLRTDVLEHGACYAGQLRAASVNARWHAVKRRFVYAEYLLGSQQVKAAPHLDDAGTADLFLPLSKAQPKAAHRITDYAFETAGL